MSRPTHEQLDAAIEYVNLAMEEGDIWGWENLGIRSQDYPFTLGPMDWESQIIDENGDETGEYLGGVSATDVNARERYMHTQEGYGFSSYIGDYVAILTSRRAFGGDDLGELVMVDPEVVYIF